jgi:hypothetical protein
MRNRLSYGWQLTEFHPKRAYFDGTARKILDNVIKYKNLKNEDKRKSYLYSLDATNRKMIEKYVRQGLSGNFLEKIRNDLSSNCLNSRAQRGGYKEKMGCGLVKDVAKTPNARRTFSASDVPQHSAWSARSASATSAKNTGPQTNSSSKQNARSGTRR